MNKTLIALTLVCIIAIAGIGGLYLYTKNSSQTDVERALIDSGSSENGEVKLTGRFICLPAKNPAEVETTECASGFKSRDGKIYRLRLPISVQQLEMNKDVTIEGTFISENDPNYESLGTILVINYDVIKK